MTKNHCTPLALVPALAMAVLAAPAAYAAPTPAGTTIENTASASFTTPSGGSQTVQSNQVDILVDELLDNAVSWQDGSAVSINNTATLVFRITNTGNGPEAFTLDADPNVAGNDFNVTVDNLAIDVNQDGVYTAADDTLVSNGASSPVIAAGDFVQVLILVTAPAGAQDTDTSVVNLEATAVTGSGPAGTTFAGQGANGSDAVVGATTAQQDDDGTLIASVAAVTLVKSSVVVDPFNGSKSVPGSTITYTLQANVTGGGTVNGLVISDTIPTGTTYTPGSITFNGATQTDAADTDASTGSQAGGVSVNLGNVASPSTSTVTFAVTIDK
ncbi:MAG: hypothetical protein WA954_02485 [Parerythrobacter sp.]